MQERRGGRQGKGREGKEREWNGREGNEETGYAMKRGKGKGGKIWEEERDG